MKKLFIILMVAVTALSQSCKNGGSKEGGNEVTNETRAFKTMIVEYQNDFEMMGMKVTEAETKWIDEKGDREATLTKKTTLFLGNTTVEESLEIKDGDWAYDINLLEKTGTKANIKGMKEMAQAMVATGVVDIDEKNMKEFVEKNGGQILGSEEMLGKECMVIEMLGMKQWMYKGIILKMVMGEKVMKQAIRIEENASIPSDRFKVPEGINITEQESPF